MPIKTELHTLYKGSCDKCGDFYMAAENDGELFIDEDVLVENMQNDGWLVNDDDEITCETCADPHLALDE